MTDFYAQLEAQLHDAARRHRDRGPARRALAGRGRMLATACVAALALALGLGTAWVVGDDDGATMAPAAPAPPTEGPAGPLADSSVRGVRVAVLNATTSVGVARNVADRLGNRGAMIETVGNFVDQQRRTSVVAYRPGHADDARRVLRVLRITLLRPATASERVLAPGSPAIVIVGRDLVGRRYSVGPG